MFGMATTDHKPRVSAERHDGEILIRISNHRWIEIDWECLRLDFVSGRRDAAEMLLAQRNRRHSLIEDNPSSD
jgi:hypothetical protein